MRGDPLKLIYEYSKSFCLGEAMDAAGYRGRGRIYEAVRDIEKHAHILRREVVRSMRDPHEDERMARIIGEYERIAFSDDDEGIRVADKLKALDMYRLLTEPHTEPCTDGGNGTLVVNYDYGDTSSETEAKDDGKI